jgi:hypothetical protein
MAVPAHRRGAAANRRPGSCTADAKSTNWIVFADPVRGPSPVLIDLDGVRHYRWAMMGIDRLLRAMKQHASTPPHDSLMLCRAMPLSAARAGAGGRATFHCNRDR